MNFLRWIFDIMVPASFKSGMVHRSELRCDKTGVLFDRKHVGRLAKLCLVLSATRPGMYVLSNLIHLHLISTFGATALSRSRSETGFRRRQYSSDGKSDADEQRLWINTTSASSDNCSATLIRGYYHSGREREKLLA